MRSIITTCYCLLISLSLTTSHLYNPYYNLFDQPSPLPLPYSPYSPFSSLSSSPVSSAESFTNSLLHTHRHHTYAPIAPSLYAHDRVLNNYLAQPDVLPTLNIIAERPLRIVTDVQHSFGVVPLLAVAQENMRMVQGAQIMGISQERPSMQVKTDRNEMLQCTPAVRIELPQPMLIYSLKTTILFPGRIIIEHGGYSIAIRVGAVIAPIPETTFVSTETPVAVQVLYAIPTAPFTVDLVPTQKPENVDSIVVDGQTPVAVLPPRNITIISFPEREAEPVLQVDEEDEELVNRNPPVVLAPAGIVQSTQPHTIVEPFSNSKESPVLTALREEALKHRSGVATN